jgi:hypothetical protein
MPLLIVCFVLFFGFAELLPAADGLIVPTPVLWIGGILLAIASNYHKPAGLPWKSASAPANVKPPVMADPAPASPPLPAPKVEPIMSRVADFDLRPRPSISFVIRKAKQQKSSS